MITRTEVLDGQGHCDLIDVMGDELRIVNAARVSINKHSNKLKKSDIELLKRLWTDRHTTPFEMVEFAFRVKVPLFVARQWHRHRTWSYNEISRRYTSDDLGFYVPNEFRKQDQKNKQGSDGEFTERDNMNIAAKIKIAMELCYDTYQGLLQKGVAREQARMVLPQNMMTEYYAKVDLRNLLHFLGLRLDPHAQLEIRVYAYAMLDHIRKYVPNVADIFIEQLPFDLDNPLTVDDYVLQDAIH